MKLRGGEWLVLLLLLTRGRQRPAAPAPNAPPFVPEPGPDNLGVEPLPPNPLDPNNRRR